MAIEFVGTLPAVTATNGGAVTLTFSNFRDGQNTAVTPLLEGDVILAAFTHTHPTTGQTIATTSTGWTKEVEDEQLGGTARIRAAVFSKIMGSTPDTSIVMTAPGNTATGCGGVAIALRGIDPNQILDVSIVTTKAAGASIPDPGSITPKHAGSYIVVFGFGGVGTAAAYTVPANCSAATNRFRTGSATETIDAQIAVAVKEDWTTGAFDPAVFGGGAAATTNSAYIAFVISLKQKPEKRTTTWNTVYGANRGQYLSVQSLKGRKLSMVGTPNAATGTRATNSRTGKRRFEVSLDGNNGGVVNGTLNIGVTDAATTFFGVFPTPGTTGPVAGSCLRITFGATGSTLYRNGNSQPATYAAAAAIGDRFAVEFDTSSGAVSYFHRPVGTGVWSLIATVTLTTSLPSEWFAYCAGYAGNDAFTGYFTQADIIGPCSPGYQPYDGLGYNGADVEWEGTEYFSLAYGSATASKSFNFGAGPRLVFVNFSDSATRTITSVTCGGVAMTKLSSVADADGLSVWVAPGTSAATETVQVTTSLVVNSITITGMTLFGVPNTTLVDEAKNVTPSADPKVYSDTLNVPATGLGLAHHVYPIGSTTRAEPLIANNGTELSDYSRMDLGTGWGTVLYEPGDVVPSYSSGTHSGTQSIAVAWDTVVAVIRRLAARHSQWLT